MEQQINLEDKSERVIIRKCHRCGHLIESEVEQQRCPKCQKHFLPLNYFGKVKGSKNSDYSDLFASSEELSEEELVRGVYVLW